MRKKSLLLTLFCAVVLVIDGQEKVGPGNWKKYEKNPILGGDLGTVYDPCILPNETGGFQMFFSWYDEGLGIASTTSKEGLFWEKPTVCFEFDFIKECQSWDRYGNRPAVVVKDGVYHMWYNGQNAENGCIGYATSKDGKNWTKKSEKPVLIPTETWENRFIFCSQVVWDKQQQLYKMWYSAGERVEPNAIGYATSKDGLNWTKHQVNPIFRANPKNKWESAKVNNCQVIKRENDYLMFYTGYTDPEHAQIGMAKSKNGVTGWVRFSGNPILKPGTGWDCDALYAPFAVLDAKNNRWLLYYNGRRQWTEQIGVAIFEKADLKF